ncbi:amino acid adenylation domain-containing protein [Brevibacillus dissolubilis]|uniref:amino acid adenylation domain-containing protein n=1 Tax=Brevibacillus dissolubilis TaxID=1844116 RepID=UPI0034CDF2D2
MTTNGKVDKRALPKPDPTMDTGMTYTAPRNEQEAKLAEIWQQVLGLSRVGIHDNFFMAGGHSLKATVLVSRIHKELGILLSIRSVFENATVAEQAAMLAEIGGEGALPTSKPAGTTDYAAIPLTEPRDLYPVSAAQKRMLLLHQMEENGINYNMPIMWEIEGAIDPTRLEQALHTLVTRHESLRTSFVWKDGEPLQRIEATVDFEMEIRQVEPRDGLFDQAVQAFIQLFDLSQAPLFRAQLLTDGVTRHLLMLDMHHIITDGVSLNLLFQELTSLYEGKELPPLRIQYKEYAVWQEDLIQTDYMLEQKAYWQHTLGGELPVLQLPTDYPRPPVQSFEGDRIPFVMEEGLAQGLRELAAQTGSTMYMVLLASLHVLLAKYSGQDDILIGSPAAGRPHADLHTVVGMFVNTVVMRGNPAWDKNFTGFLAEIKERALQAFENQDYPFEQLLETLEVRRDISRNPLFDVMFALHDAEDGTPAFGTAVAKPYSFDYKVAKFDLTLTLTESRHGIAGSFAYSMGLFRRDTMERLAGHFKQILCQIVDNPQIGLSEIDMVTAQEKQQLAQHNQTSAPYPSGKTMPQLFEERVQMLPAHHLALHFEGTELTYPELNEKANQLARTLVAKGVQPQDIVAIMTERSLEMIIAILAVLKAGAAYMPIDPVYPQERKSYMLEDSQAKFLLTQTHLLEVMLETNDESNSNSHLPFAGEILDLNDTAVYHADASDLNIPIQPDNLAYVIYTSGTTGRPKGVMLPHHGIVNLQHFVHTAYGLTEQDRMPQFASFAFDAAVMEIFVCLLNGASMYLMTKETAQDPSRFEEFVDRHQLTAAILSPVFLVNVKADRIPSMRFMLTGGSAPDKSTVDTWKKRTYVNGYGPTEASVMATGWVAEEREDSLVPMGGPIDNVQVYVVNTSNQLQPVGLPGELCISGAGLALGYLNRPELTEEKFVLNPFIPGERMYRTGDIVKWLPDGNLEYISRIDDQVKIHGHRIETGEIEATLLTHEAVHETIVIPYTDATGQTELCAYLTATRELGASELRQHLKQTLPAYMIPSYLVQLARMPLTVNNKIDKKRLPAPSNQLHTGVEYTAPRNETEAVLAAIWQDVLGIGRAGIYDNFFDLGGHSLKATVLVTRIHQQWNVQLSIRAIFQHQTIAELAPLLAELAESEAAATTAVYYESIPLAEKRDTYPVSSAQKRLLIVGQMIEASTNYNMPVFWKIDGSLEPARLEQAFQTLVDRHESLRTSFEWIDNKPVQRIHEPLAFTLGYSHAAEDELEQTAKQFVQPFAIDQAPLMRADLVIYGENRHLLMLDMHHLISDGVSTQILLDELSAIYSDHEQYEKAQADANKDERSEPRIQYKDFTAWQEAQYHTDQMQRQEAFWMQVLDGELPVLQMPTDYPRPSVQSFDGDLLTFAADSELTQALRSLATQTGTTIYMVLLAALQVLLSKYSRQEDILVGSPIAGRSHAELQQVVGMFVNTLVLRGYPESQKTFAHFLQEIKETSLNAFEHQDYPFEELVGRLNLQRDLTRNPIFDVMFAVQNAVDGTLTLDGATVMPFDIDQRAAKFDLHVTAMDSDKQLSFYVTYATKLFARETMQRFAGHLTQVLRAVAGNPDILLADVDILTDAEKHQLLVTFNQTDAGYPSDVTIHQLFEEQARLHPDNTAVVCGEESLTYRQLNEKANQLARLIRSKGILPNDFVGLLIERSLDMLVGIIAIIKAGGVYVPIDPEYPEDRKAFMLEDSGAKLLLTNDKWIGTVPFDGEVIELHDDSIYTGDCSDLPSVNTPDDMAYIIYTSGTTGKPKGVMIEHRNVVRLMINDQSLFDFNENDVWTMFHSFCFDFSVWEMYGAFLYGGKLVIVPKETAQNPEEFAQLLRKQRVTILNQTPTAFYSLLHIEEQIQTADLSIRCIIFGGEALHPIRLKPFHAKYPAAKLINMYGITETTVHVTYKEITAQEMDTNLSNIGTPIPTLTTYIFDPQQKLVPLGVVGEMYVGGLGVARGYLNREELTSERFIVNPYNPSERLYRSGDLARMLPNGEMEYQGRIDHQVKIRGFRIEIGEIETQLLSHPEIHETIVIARKNELGQDYLCAYFTASATLSISDLRQYLSINLPTYMIPSHFMQLDAMPLTSNGKVDRKKLPAPEGNQMAALGNQIAPRNDMEHKIASIWKSVLGLHEVGVTNSFFDVGGNSLSLMTVHQQVKKELEREFPLVELFRYTTIEELSAYLQTDQQNKPTVKDMAQTQELARRKRDAIQNQKGLRNNRRR